MILRGIAFAAGVLLLAATAHVTISATGGYWQPHAALTMAIALGVGVGALSISATWNAKRKALSVWLFLAILAGEAFGFMATAERLVVGREANQAPLRAAQGEIAKTRERVAAAERAVKNTPARSERLATAEADKTRVDTLVGEQSALPGCREHCRKLLEAQVQLAQAEVGEARNEIASVKMRLERDLTEARMVLRHMASPPSATPLSDRLGLPSWALDLLTSALGSLAANGLGCGLIAFAVHRRKEEPPAPTQAKPSPVPAPERLHSARAPQTLLALMHRGDVPKFLVNKTDRVPGARTELDELYEGYLAACREDGEQPDSRAEFDRAFFAACDKAHIQTQGIGDRVYALDVKLMA